MIAYAEALTKILENTKSFPKEQVLLENLLGYVLAEPLICETSLPRFDNSAVDGYGVLVEDANKAAIEHPVLLKLLGTITAGDTSTLELSSGSAIKILTGAMVPSSVEAVIMQEFCNENNGSVQINRNTVIGENIRRKGEEFLAGQTILISGVRINPPIIGLLASLGYQSFLVHKKPKVSLVVTGNELVKPGESLKLGQIYDSNSYGLTAALTVLGIESKCFHAKDTAISTEKAFAQAFDYGDLIISSGGVSVGEHDFVKKVLEQNGVNTVFWKIAIKPGKPVYFGVAPEQGNQKLVFGLPGNPVSALVTFHQFVKPAILKMMGLNPRIEPVTAIVASTLKKKQGRLDFVRGKYSVSNSGALNVVPTIGQDSHMLSGLAQANCLIHFAEDDNYVSTGASIPIQFLNWNE